MPNAVILSAVRTAVGRAKKGTLANTRPDELAAVDRQRKDLVANVSHELRTPISALRATLENVVDGVVEPDPALLRTMLAQTERLQRLVAAQSGRLQRGAAVGHRNLGQPVFRKSLVRHHPTAFQQVVCAGLNK